MEYVFRKRREALWAMATAVGFVVLTSAASFDPNEIVDWETWAKGIGAGSVRAAGGALLAMLTSHKQPSPQG
jgi:hypothetical protein